MGKNERAVAMNGPGQGPVLRDHLRTVRFDHCLPRPVVRMDAELTQDDQPATAHGPPAIVGDMPVGQETSIAEVGPVGGKADAVRQREPSEGQGTEEEVKHGYPIPKSPLRFTRHSGSGMEMSRYV